ncbi:MAG TPA: enolase C-terminal domain-like protein [Actinomycetes bacterium]|nr:enolase C-terminal domain-like protein [Actinomycetes bacterium]
MTTLTEHPLRIPGWRHVVLLEGPEGGWGEWSPLPGYPSDPAVCRRAAEEAARREWPLPRRSRVRVNTLVPAVPPGEAAALAAGSCDVKVKVGDDGDVDRVAAVREAIGPRGRLRVDANGAWDVERAVTAIARLAPYDLELVEQPVASLQDLAAVRRRLAVPVAADECVRDLDDARRLAQLRAADALVVKVQPLGGFTATFEVAAAAGVPVIVSSMHETSIGLAAGLALAAALDELPYACGLGTAGLLPADVVADPLLPEDGWLAVRRPVPDPALVARYEAGG